ncbi:MAG: chromosome segregation protein SMC [Candidatus Dormibacteraeota bacterium]|nr:chromosome segregation protein SMC [Candidatus Dormibacteraeota bacterium]
MHLKSLRIQGFKTFARRTDLPFSRGITAIVGPNGSGKSNLVDAIRWGLGERNARGLRGQRMEDVIYSGGPGKSAVGMAEVSLTIDNADQRLNVEFTEIEVARRLFRSGESDYLINGTRARLKDIDLLLSSTGLRQDGYAVTAQNDIDYVIQAAPGLRRELIEEAAGVRRLRDQRQEALNRLAEAERDMRRARDILAELTPRAAELETQARAAEEYQRVADQLKSLQGSLAKDAWRKAMVLLRRAHSRRQSADQKRAAAGQALDEFAPKYAEHRAALLEAREARWKHQEAVAALRLQLAEREHQARIAEERASAATQALAAAEQEMVRLAATAQAGVRVVEELEQAAARTDEELRHLAAGVTAAVDGERAARDLLEGLEQDRAALAQQRQDLHRDAVANDAELRQVEGRTQFLSEQRQQADLHLESWSRRRATAVEEVERCALRATEADDTLRSAIAATGAIEEELGNGSTELTQAEARLAELTARVGNVEAEVRALERLRDGGLPQSRLADDPEFQQLLELIEVSEEDRPVIEAALEGWLHAWVPANQEAAQRAIGMLAQAAAPRETILHDPDNPLAAPESGGLVGVATLIVAPPHVEGLLRHLLDRTILVANQAEGRNLVFRHPSFKAVTRAGEVITAASYRAGAFRDAPLEVQAQVRAAQSGLGAARSARMDAVAVYEDLSRRRAVLHEERAAALVTADAARSRAAESAAALAMAQAALIREDQQESQLRGQIERLGSLLEQAQAAQQMVLTRQEELSSLEVTLTVSLREADEQIGAASSTLKVAVQERQDVELRAALARQRHEDLLRQLERAREVWRAHGDELAQRQAATLELSAQPLQLEGERRRCLLAAQDLLAELGRLETASLPDAGLLTSLEAQVQEGEQRNVQLQVELAHADDAVAAALMDVESAQVEVDRCALALREDGQVVEEDEPIAEVDWQKTERDVSRLQRRLDAMGAVNLLAPEEYAQVRERCDSLGSQLADLEAASAQLLELRERLENEIDERFRTVFHSVAINFQEFFAELFEGGRATLRLEADENANRLDEGVEILAQTPGKRLQPLTLLSGGERALTALAFLFALQAVNPSPFYVLDEVDAALDDANVLRFNRVLKRLSREQQFLIVTHNHSTMAQAEVLYGVTLGEHGISRIVSVRMEQDALMPVGERSA